MEINARKPLLRFAPAKAGFALAGLLPLLVAGQVQAVEFSFADDEIAGSIDTLGKYRDKIPLNRFGVAPVIIPSVGTHYGPVAAELVLLGFNAAMVTTGVRF